MKKHVKIEVDVIIDTNDFAGEKLTEKDIARILKYINHGDDNDVLSLLFGGKKQAAKITQISEC